MYYMLSSEGRKRYFDELLPLLHRTKLEVMGPRDDDCYYLVYLGTKPKARGRGYARKLIEDMVRVVSPTLLVVSFYSHPVNYKPWSLVRNGEKEKNRIQKKLPSYTKGSSVEHKKL